MTDYFLIRKGKNRMKKVKLLLACVLILIVFHILSAGKFLLPTNLLVIISHTIIPSFIVWGLCFIFNAGVMDLSIGAITIIASNIAGFLGLKLGYPGLIVGGIIVGMALCFINSQVFYRLKIPSWIAGLAMAMVYESAASFYKSIKATQGQDIVNLVDQVRGLGSMPFNMVFWVLGFALAYLLFNYTSVGLNIRAISSNADISGKMGVDIYKSLVMAVVVGGMFVGLSGAINISYAGKILPVTGLSSVSMIFQPLAALLLAGAMSKIFNVITGATIGMVMIAALFNFLTLLGVPSGTWQEIILGLSVILIAAISQKNERGVVK